jgi:Sec-independent protein translocase protein TatA
VRAIFILSIFIILILSGCTTVEIVKEVTKATNSIKTSIKKISSNKEELQEQTSNDEELQGQTSNEEKLKEKISMEKQEITIEKKKKEKVVLKQKKIATISFIGKTLDQLTKQLGEPMLLREDGKSKTVRYDTRSCRIFIFFNTSIKEPRAEYYELRTTKGKLVERQKDIEKCFSEIKLV